MLGDVLAVVAALAGICVSAWSLTMLVATLFPLRAERAQTALAERPGRAFGVGLGLWLTVGVLALTLMNAPNPLAKFLGIAVGLGLLATAVVGLAGVAGLAAERLQRLDAGLSAYAAQTRGALFVIGGAMLPFLGWFLVAPMALIFGLGAGFQALPRRARRAVEVEAGAGAAS